MKLSGLTMVAPRFPSSRATYAPAKPPPTTSVPPAASRRSGIAAYDRTMAAPQVAVVGSGPDRVAEAEEVGRLLAERGCTVVTGGLGEVMAAAHRGAKAAGGTTIAILPGEAHADANPWADHVVVTGIGHARNLAVAASGHAVIAVGGSYGTLAEIAFALRLGRPVVQLGDGPAVEGVVACRDPARGCRTRPRVARYALTSRPVDLAEAPLEKAPLGRVVGERERRSR